MCTLNKVSKWLSRALLKSLVFLECYFPSSFCVYFSQKYNAAEMEAAYALLELSKSAQNPPPVDKTENAAKPNAYSTSVEPKRKPPITPEALQQAPMPTTGSQVSLTELNCFAAATVTDGEQRYVSIHYTSPITM